MDRFERQRKIFGDKGQKQLRATTVGVVGGGGLGSLLALQLAYLGIGKIVVIDHKSLKRSHRNRLVGAWASHANGTPKVHLLRDLATLVDPEIEIDAVPHCFENPTAQHALERVDVVVGCVDHDGPRFLVNEFCCRRGLPFVDAASDTIPEDDGVLFGGRVCVVTPTTGCLVCLNVLNQDEIQEYLASSEQRADRRNMYGVPENALPGGGPSVVTVNGVVASVAATELMVLVTGIRPPIGHQDWRGHEGCLRRVIDRKEGCYYCALRPSD